MIRKGQTIENPLTGERMTFLATSAETGGEYVLVEVALEPNGFVAAPHVHPKQEERFEVVEGTLEFRRGKDVVLAGPGDVVVVPAGTPHRFENAGDGPARFRCTVTPALGFERLLETMFALAADGRTNRNGMPNPLRLAVIANAHFEDVNLPFPPAFLQRAALALGAPLGKLLGYGPTYDGGAGAPAIA